MSKPIKEVPETELKKHKVKDIIGFIKAGNLPMVHGLINYFGIGHGVIVLRGSTDEFTLHKHKIKMSDWNPLLIAVAFKRLDIVRYFVQECRVSLRLALADPQASLVEDHEAKGTTTA